VLLSGCGQEKPAGAPQSLEPLLGKAEELSALGLYTEAAQLLGSSDFAGSAEERARLELEIGRLYNRANVHDLALPAAEAALKLGSKEPDALYVQADALRHLRRPGAEQKLESLLEAVPDHLQAKLSLARIRMHSSQPASALPLFEEYFRRAEPSDANYKVALLEHARALRNAGRYQECADRYTVLLEADPLEGTFYSGLAEALYRLKLRQEGRFVEEIYKLISQSAFEEHVEDRLRETGNTAFAQAQKAINRTRQRRYLEAFQSYSRALEYDRSDARLRALFADLAIQFRRFEEARSVLKDAIGAGMKPASGLHWMLGRLLLEEESYREAAGSFASGIQALSAEGDQGGVERGQAPVFSIHLALARCWIELREGDRAREAALAAQALSQTSWEPAYWLGRAELLAGRPREALALFAEASQKGGKDLADLGVYSAMALERTGRAGDAVSRLEALIKAQPGLLPAHEELVRILKSSGAAAAPAADEALNRLLASRAEIRSLQAKLKDLRLADCGPVYFELGKLHLALREPRAFDCFFLAADLLPRSAEVCRLLLSGMRQSQDIFVRLRYLRRLHALEPADPGVLAALAGLYLKLHVRLDEAERLAQALHGIKPTPESYRLTVHAAFLRGDDSRARALLSEALAAFPSDAGLKELAGKLEKR